MKSKSKNDDEDRGTEEAGESTNTKTLLVTVVFNQVKISSGGFQP